MKKKNGHRDASGYIFSDHTSTSLSTGLGSTSIVADAQGNKVSELRYAPWGEVRYRAASRSAAERVPEPTFRTLRSEEIAFFDRRAK